MHKRILCCLVIASLGSQFSLASQDAESLNFADGYANDHLWPATVTPSIAIHDASGQKMLDSSIPVVLSRAYEDGTLAVIDRIGCLLIDYKQTNFVESVNELRMSLGDLEGSHHTRILLNQLARRIYDKSYSESKAVSEEELKKYSQFLIIRTSSKTTSLQATLAQLRSLDPYLEDKNVCAILIFDELMPNAEFNQLVAEMDVTYPVVVPIFQKGLIQALYTEREQEDRVLLLMPSGKLVEKAVSLETFLKTKLDSTE